MSKEPNYSDNQKQFLKDVEKQNLTNKLRLNYSGRGMYGDTCPGVVVDSPGKFNTKADTEWDHMGLSFIIYAKK